MWTARNSATVISGLRIPLGIAFLSIFQKDNINSVCICIAIALIAQISDHLDGWIVRRYSSPSLSGWIEDSFSDRAFYIGCLLAFEREYNINLAIVWIFIMREILYYAVRVTSGDFVICYKKSRFVILLHAGVVRVAIAILCLFPTAGYLDISSMTIIGNVLFLISSLVGYYMLFRVATARH